MAKRPVSSSAKTKPAASPKKKPAAKKPVQPKLDVRRDSMDFRDLTYNASLTPLPDELYPVWPHLTILNQGQQGACTGFGLAAAINYLRAGRGQQGLVSPAMLFAMARRYDQWPGENYDYSSARGAMKGWHKHGVCLEQSWPLTRKGGINPTIQQQALDIPLGAYFRVFSRINDVQAALRDVGVLFASAQTHAGWDAPRSGKIVWQPNANQVDSGHAFAIVGYTLDGFLVQNSWGNWGGFTVGKHSYPGVALWSYADFEANVWDVWVAQLGVKVNFEVTDTASRYTADGGTARATQPAPPQESIYLHYLHIDNGRLDDQGQYASDTTQLGAIIAALQTSQPKHLVLYAHGGLNTVESSAMRAFKWRPVFEANGVYELHFIWETGLWSELGDLLHIKKPGVDERVGAASSWWDNQVEKLTQPLGFSLWQEMKLDAQRAFVSQGAGSLVLKRLLAWLGAQGKAAPQVHLAGHSAGSIWHAYLLQRWQALNGPQIANLLLFAPACSVELYQQSFLPALGKAKGIARQKLLVLSDQAEEDDNVAQVYRKSLLYLVSNAYDNKTARIPILGMEIAHMANGKYLPQPAGSTLLIASSASAQSSSRSHGGFDNDVPSMNNLLQTVVGSGVKRLFKDEDMKGY
ncbi:hypothetical protein ACVW0Y_002631 [Pseudomonas sp. TE3786]